MAMNEDFERYANAYKGVPDTEQFHHFGQWKSFRSYQKQWGSGKECMELKILTKTDKREAIKQGIYLGLHNRAKNEGVGFTGLPVFSPDMKRATFTNDKRRKGNRINFPDDSKEEYENCWYLCGKKHKIDYIETFRKINAVIENTPVTREEECPCCLEKKEGIKITCSNQHQTCIECFKMLHANYRREKNCPVCRVVFSQEETDKGNQVPTEEIVSTRFRFQCKKEESNYYWAFFFKTILDNWDKFDETLIAMGIWRYVDLDDAKPFMPYNDDLNETFYALSDDAWKPVFEYLRKESTMKELCRSDWGNHNIGMNESEYLSLAIREWGLNAGEVLATGNSQDQKERKRFLYLKYKFYTKTDQELLDLVNQKVTQWKRSFVHTQYRASVLRFERVEVQ